MQFYPPLGPLGLGQRTNATLHGRSRFRPADVPGHNVFNGFTRPGWGDAIDLFCPGGTAVYAAEECRQVLHRHDASRLEVIYLQGARLLLVMAHVDAARVGTGHRYRAGDVVARVRSDLRDPHLHLEVARGSRGQEKPLVGRVPRELLAQLHELFAPAPARVVDVVTGEVLGEVFSLGEIPRAFPGCAMVPGGDHRADQGKVYVSRRDR
jgi:murein DD-endopeptidase MepM/ murein hydrolase activator NlpD